MNFDLLKFSEILPLILSAIGGLITYIVLVFTNNLWSRNITHYLTFILLPPIACSITKVISGNLALSLGMVGALSIIRFRNPVRSPLELAIYFFLITSGIVFNVDYNFGIIFVLFIYLLIICSNYLMIICAKINFFSKYFSKDVSSGNNKILELTMSKRDKELDFSEKLLFSSKILNDENKELFTYRIKVSSENQINKLLEKDLISYNLFNENN